MNLKEETLEKNTIYTGRIITVRNDTALLPNGKRASREVVEHPGGVTIAALTPEGELLFVRQYRYPYGEELLELPAGKLERGEDPLAKAVRMVLENEIRDGKTQAAVLKVDALLRAGALEA